VFRHLPSDQLPDAGDLVGRFFDQLGEAAQVQVRLGRESAVDGFFDDAGPAHPDIDHRVRSPMPR